MLNVLKVVGPWVAFRVIWRPFLRHVYRTLVNSYDYKEYDATAITCYVILCCGVAALLLSMYLNGQLYWACAWSVTYGAIKKKGRGNPYSITERRVPELIPVLGSQPAGDVTHKPGGRLPLLSTRPAVTPATLKRAATSFAVW